MTKHIIKTDSRSMGSDKDDSGLSAKEKENERQRLAEYLRQSRIKELILFLDKKRPWDCLSRPKNQ